jgi:mannosyltransferase
MKQFLNKYGLLLILSFSLFLQTFTLGSHSFWFDESYTSAITSESASKAIELTTVDVHPPLYYVALNAWGDAFGRSDIGLRSFSVVFAMLSIFLLYLLLRRFFSKPVSLFATFIASIAPYTIRYAQEARMYTLASALLIGATLVLVVQLQRSPRKRSLVLWLLYGVLLTGALYTHYFSSLIVLAHAVYALYIQPKPKSEKIIFRLLTRIKSLDKGLFISFITAVMLYIPWLPKLQEQYNSVSGGFWIPGVNETSIATIASYAFGFYEVASRSVLAYVIMVLVVLSGIFIYKFSKSASKEHKSGLILLFSGFMLPVIALFFISIIGTSYFYFRYFAQFSLLLYGGVGAVIALTYQHQPTKQAARILGSILIIMLSISTARVLIGVDKTDIDMNTSYSVVNESFEPGDVVVAIGFFHWFDATHYNQTGQEINYLDEELGYGSLAPINDRGITIQTLESLNDYGRVWVIRSPSEVVVVPGSWGQASLQVSGDDAVIDLYDLNN